MATSLNPIYDQAMKMAADRIKASKKRTSENSDMLSQLMESRAPVGSSPGGITGGGTASASPMSFGGNVGNAPGALGAVLKSGQSKIGTPYVWGGTSPSGYDCSGLMQTIFRQAGINLPRTSRQQAAYGKPIDAAHAKKGDLVYYGRGSGVHHIGLYLGNGKYLDAPHTGARVRIENIGPNVGGFTRVLKHKR